MTNPLIQIENFPTKQKKIHKIIENSNRNNNAPHKIKNWIYELNWHSMAHPLSVQCDGFVSGAQFSVMATTKFVLWPVVDSVPRLSVVLYTGQIYECRSFKSLRLMGVNHIWKIILAFGWHNMSISGLHFILTSGIVSYNILGSASDKHCVVRSHRAPSKNNPYT